MEGYSQNILKVRSFYFRTWWFKIKKTFCVVTNFKYPVSQTQIWLSSPWVLSVEPCVCTEGTSFLHVAVDECDPVGRNDVGKQSRRRLLFGSGPAWYYKYPLSTGLLWTCLCQALGGTSCLVPSKRVCFLAFDLLNHLQNRNVERTRVASWCDLNLGLFQATLEPYDVHL